MFVITVKSSYPKTLFVFALFRCIALAEVAAGLRTRLVAALHSASLRVALVRRRIDKLSLCLELTESAARRTRDDIDRRCDDVIRVAERARNQLIAGVDDLRSRGSESIRKRRTDAESDAAALESAMASVERLRVDGSDATIVDAAKRFEDTLTEALAEMEKRDENETAGVGFVEIRFELPLTDVVVDETFGSISIVERRLTPDIADGTEVGVENSSSIDVTDPRADQSTVDRLENPPTIAATAALSNDVEQRYVASDDDADSSSFSAVTSSMPPDRPTENAADATSTSSKTIDYDRQFSTESGLSISDRSTASDAVIGASAVDSSRRRSSSDAGYLTTWDSASELATIISTAESDIPTAESSDTWWPCGSTESSVPPSSLSEWRRPGGFDDRSRRRQDRDEGGFIASRGVVVYRFLSVDGQSDAEAFESFCSEHFRFSPRLDRERCRRIGDYETPVVVDGFVLPSPLLVVCGDEASASGIMAGYRRSQYRMRFWYSIGMSRYHAKTRPR